MIVSGTCLGPRGPGERNEPFTSYAPVDHMWSTERKNQNPYVESRYLFNHWVGHRSLTHVTLVIDSRGR